MYLQTQGFVLKTKDWQEADRMYTLYTKKAGKLVALARGVRKIKSKLAGHLQPFKLINLHLVHGKYRFQLIGASVITNYKVRLWRQEQTAISLHIGYGYYFLELVDKITKEEQKNEQVFKLLKQGFQVLKTINNEQALKRLRVSFLLKLLKLKGYNPEKRVKRNLVIQKSLKEYLETPFQQIINQPNNGPPVSETGGLKTLFNISQYTVNEVIEKPMQTVKFLQSL